MHPRSRGLHKIPSVLHLATARISTRLSPDDAISLDRGSVHLAHDLRAYGAQAFLSGPDAEFIRVVELVSGMPKGSPLCRTST